MIMMMLLLIFENILKNAVNVQIVRSISGLLMPLFNLVILTLIPDNNCESRRW